MAHQKGVVSNGSEPDFAPDPERVEALFETLSDWNEILKNVEFDMEEPCP